MATNHAETELRRYLLGELADEPAATLEGDYFAREELFDRVRVAESDLVDDYLAARLSAHERDRFEQHYLATPLHRRRLAVARELRAAAAAAARVRAPIEARPWWTTAVHALRGSRRTLTPALGAAVVLVLVVVGAWMLRSRYVPPAVVTTSPHATTQSSDASPPSQSAREQRPESRGAPDSRPAGPVTVALALSPFTVRGADETPILRIPEGTDLVVLHLEGDATAPVIVGGRAVVRTVSGKEIWRGPAAAARSAQSATVARVEIPAATLTPDDYTVALSGTDRNGRAAERYRYFLRVAGR